MRTIRRIAAHARVLARARRNRTDLLRWLVRRPQLLAGTGAYEAATLLANRADPRPKALAELEVATMVHCEFCIDIASALALRDGVTEAQVAELHRYRDSDAFDEDDRLVLELAEAMTGTPANVTEHLRGRLLARFSPGQVTELAAAIAWENQRARLNDALGVRPAGFSDGAVCALPSPGSSGPSGSGQRGSVRRAGEAEVTEAR
jgi:AhpD family alkylhydroperoxidase